MISQRKRLKLAVIVYIRSQIWLLGSMRGNMCINLVEVINYKKLKKELKSFV